MSAPQAREIVERPVQLQGNALARGLLRLLGWQLLWNGLPARQGVLVVYPHTSNWDFPLGLLAKWAFGVQVTFWGKDSLFRVPGFSHWMRWLGGVPVDRRSPGGIVGDMVARMRAARAADRMLWLALAPEGTRARGAPAGAAVSTAWLCRPTRRWRWCTWTSAVSGSALPPAFDWGATRPPTWPRSRAASRACAVIVRNSRPPSA